MALYKCCYYYYNCNYYASLVAGADGLTDQLIIFKVLECHDVLRIIITVNWYVWYNRQA